MLNSVSFSGRLVADPEVRVFDSGSRLIRLRVALQTGFRVREGEQYLPSIVVKAEVWPEALGQLVLANFQKGDQIAFIGRVSGNEAYLTRNGLPGSCLVVSMTDVMLPPLPIRDEAEAVEAEAEAVEAEAVEELVPAF